jgi:hypothetical protein
MFAGSHAFSGRGPPYAFPTPPHSIFLGVFYRSTQRPALRLFWLFLLLRGLRRVTITGLTCSPAHMRFPGGEALSNDGPAARHPLAPPFRVLSCPFVVPLPLPSVVSAVSVVPLFLFLFRPWCPCGPWSLFRPWCPWCPWFLFLPFAVPPA